MSRRKRRQEERENKLLEQLQRQSVALEQISRCLHSISCSADKVVELSPDVVCEGFQTIRAIAGQKTAYTTKSEEEL